MKKHVLTIRLFIVAASLLIVFGSVQASFGAATIQILNGDAAGVGFNDPTVVAPVGGNSGTTLGQQRMIAYQAAAAIWGATLDSSVTIRIKATWEPLTCTATAATLGSASASQAIANFGGAPFTSTYYGIALADKINGSEMGTATFTPPTAPVGTPPSIYHISARFNVNLGLNANCLPGQGFYLGLDGNEGNGTDLEAVLLHELAHGLGFQTLTNAQTGALFGTPSFPTIFDRFLIDATSGKSWVSMTNSERAASTLNSRKLAWNGPQVSADVQTVLGSGTPVVAINSPASIAGNYDAGTASFGPQITAGGITGDLLLANSSGPNAGGPTSGCNAFSANFFNGTIAVIDRTSCSFKTKTLNAQNAGAIAVIVVDNTASTPPAGLGDDPTIVTPITIPTLRVTQADGTAIKNAMTSTTVNGSLKLDPTRRAGADAFGKALMYTPNPFESGSSVSHWDTIETPNQLMEPAINDDLTHNVTPNSDLTFSQLRDIGWVARALPTSLVKTQGDLQRVNPGSAYPVPLQVTGAPGVPGLDVTWTIVPQAITGADGAFTGGTRVAVSQTDALGVATSPNLTANLNPGGFTVNATIPGAGTQSFLLLVLGTTAANASISGQVLATGGRGLTNAVVLLTDADGSSQTFVTGRSGAFNFENVETGRTYVITVGSQRFTYQPQTVTVNDNVAGLTFTPSP